MSIKQNEFKFRDVVWLMHDNKPKEVRICRVDTIENDDDRGTPTLTRFLYVRTDYYNTPFTVDPSDIFKTKQELLKSL